MAAALWADLCVGIGRALGYFHKKDDVQWLLTRLRVTNAELERVKTQVAAELENRSQFFNGASHDFAQRLHALKLLARSAQEESPAPAPVEKVADALEDLEAYVRYILEFARMESTNIVPNLGPVPLQDLFQRILVDFESVVEARGVELKVRTTAAVVETDPALLLRILDNLVSNAVKFTDARVLVAARRRGPGWAVEVWDQGPGIAPAEEAAIFTAFYQQQPYADRRHVGVGLGLAIVRRLAFSLQYTVAVRSRVGRGTVMVVNGLRAATSHGRLQT